MARLITSGLELGTLDANEDLRSPDGQPQSVVAGISNDTGRLGLGISQSFAASTVAPVKKRFFFTPAGQIIWARAYVRFNSVQDVGQAIQIFGLANFFVRYEATSNNFLGVIFNATNVSVIGNNLVPVISQWYKLEISLLLGVGATDVYNVWIDDVLYSSGVGDAGADSYPPNTSLDVGWNAFSGTAGSNNISFDDIAVNDDAGTVQNGRTGSSKILLLKPIADSAVGTGWTNDNAAATGLFNSVDNTPPLGITDTTTGGGGHQIRNATSNANVNYDATLQTYDSLGIGPEDVVNLVVPMVATAAPVATSAKLGNIGLVSNPPITLIALTTGGSGTASFWFGTTGSTYPIGWKWSYGTTAYNPSIAVKTNPVIRVQQVTSSTRIAMASFLGLYVDFSPGYVPTLPPATPLLVKLMKGMGKLKRLRDFTLEPLTPVASPVYLDSDTISSTTSVQSTESTDFLDTAGAINGTSSVISTELVAYVEAATVASSSSVSAVETTDFVDADTPASVTSLSAVELYVPYVDKPAIAPLLITLGERVHLFKLLNDNILGETPQVTSASYTDAATISSVTSVQSSESTDFVDTAGTINGTSSVSSAELAAFIDANTVAGTSSLTSTEVAAYVDANIPSTTTSVSSTETTNYVESSSIGSVTSVSALEEHDIPDSATISSNTSVITSDTYDVVDPNTGATTTSVISLETAQYVDSTTISGVTSPSAVEVAAYVDADTPASVTSVSTADVFVLAPIPASLQVLLIKLARYHSQLKLLGSNTLASSRPLVVYTESATIATVSSVTSTDVAAYVETATIAGVTTPSTSDLVADVDANTASGKTTPSSTDLAAFVDSATTGSVSTPSSTDFAAYVDSSTLLSKTSIQPVELFGEVDAASIANSTSVSSTDTAQFVDSDTASMASYITSTEIAAYVDGGTPTSTTTFTYTEAKVTAPTFNDAATVLTTTTIGPVFEYGPIISMYLVGTASKRRWRVQGNDSFVRWSGA